MPEIRSKTQQEAFVSKALPSLFHTTPEDFLRYLNQDGNKFLRFYWDKAGSEPGVVKKENSFGLNHQVRQPFPHVTVVLITLPKPSEPPEAYFAALVFRPQRRSPILMVSDTTMVVALEMAAVPGESTETRLREWTKKLQGEDLGPGPQPKLEEFYKVVCDLVKP